jgi:nucleolar protein 14
VFEVPTTLEALHDMIGNYASTGQDASLIIQRIHKANSVRLNRKNMEKMQNFYDVLLRRFVAVGDAIHSSGDGGPTLGRYKQLDELTKTLYAMSQDSPECAGAVWGRRLGILQNAHAKRLRDAEFAINGDHFSAWPSTGTILLLRALGHVFPVTDMRHYVVTPALLLIGQMVAQTPVRSMNDAVIGIMCAGLMIDFTKDANRIAPEALSFLAGVLRLFVVKPGRFPIPSLEAAAELPAFASLRKRVSVMSEIEEIPRLSLHTDDIEVDKAPFAVLCSALHLIEAEAVALCGSLNDAEAETFAEITESLLALQSKKYPLPELVAQKVLQVASALSSNKARVPLLRRMGPSVTESAIKTLAPRMEDPTRYSLSKDKRKTSVQAAIDRTRREYKREHKAVARELRLDAAFIESERRKEKGEKDAKAREKRNKNFSWMEGEQAAMNQQVRQGGGLLSGGGMGAARAKASSGKVGIKKGGKFKS